MNTTYLAVFLSALLVFALANQFVRRRRSLQSSMKRLWRMHRRVSCALSRRDGQDHPDAQVHVWVAYVYLESAKTLSDIGDETAARAAAECGYAELCSARRILRGCGMQFFCLEFGVPRVQ